MKPGNLLIIMSDNHAANVLRAAGDEFAITPNLDRLAARGMRFENAYCASPICVPSRASIATGRYPHEIDAWDNARPYTGAEAKSWGHRLVEHGTPVTTIGKLHFRSPDDDTGFPDQRLPLHVIDKTGNLIGLLRGDMPPLPNRGEDVLNAGAGTSSYSRYDRAIGDEACRWLQQEAPLHDRPWTLFVSFVCPHPPFVAPPEFFSQIPIDDVPLPPQWEPDAWLRHPVLDMKRRNDTLDRPFTESQIRRARAAYYALVAYMDAQVGKVLDTLESCGLEDDTRVIYTSDHGETLGTNGQWGKCSMLEAAVRVPLIVAGPDVPAGGATPQLASLVDIFPTVLDAAGVPPGPADQDLPGRSLWRLLHKPEPDRTIFAEHHATHSRRAIYMLRHGRDKYIHYTGDAPQLFDLQDDPHESRDLAGESSSAPAVTALEQSLRTIVDPERIDAQARRDQAQRVREAGGREAVIARSQGFRHTPAPAAFRTDHPRNA